MTVGLIQPYERELVLQAASRVNSDAISAAQQVAAVGGLAMQVSAMARAENAGLAVLDQAEYMAKQAASQGLSAVFQRSAAAQVISAAQTAASVVADAEAAASLIPQLLANAQLGAKNAAIASAGSYLQAAANAAAIAANPLSVLSAVGRSAPCNLNLINFGGLADVTKKAVYAKNVSPLITGTAAVPKVDRSNINFIVEIDGKKLDDTYQKYIEEIDIYETCGHEISMIRLVIHNDQRRFADDSIWDRGKKINLWNGYYGTGVVRRGNTFYSMGPKNVYQDANTPNPKIIVTGYGEEFLLSKAEVRKTWKNLSDSDIASQIAAKYGWSVKTTATTPLHNHVAQVNESDWKFLDRRARYYGFEVFVERGVLHFHQSEYIDTGIMMSYFGKPYNQLNGFTVWETPLQHGKVIQADQIDPLSKEIFTVTSLEKEDPVTVQTKSSFKDGSVVMSREIASLGQAQPVSYMFEEGHKQTRSSLGAEVEGFSQSSRWLVAGEGNVVGLLGLHVHQVLELMGLGRDSGEYYITELHTKIKAGKCTSNFKVRRTWRGGSKGSKVSPRVIQPVEGR